MHTMTGDTAVTTTSLIRIVSQNSDGPQRNLRFDPFPYASWRRWVLRVLAMVPFLLIVITADRGLWAGLRSPNQTLLEHAERITDTSSTVTWLESLYPPLPTIAAVVQPWGATGLAMLGCIAAGFFVQRVIEVLHQHRAGTLLTVLFTVAIVANPLFAYTATQNLAAFLSLMFFGLGLNDSVRFITWRNTQAGFRAGLYLMLAGLSDTSGLAYVLALVLTAPMFTLGRRGQRWARFANAVVLAFPMVAVLLTVLFLQLAFLHRWPAGNSFGFGFSQTALDGLIATTQDLRWIGLLLPLLLTWALSLAVRRPGAILVSSVLFALVFAGFLFGLVPNGSAGNSFLIMALLMIALIPAARSRALTAVLAALAILLAVVPWFAAVTRTTVIEWADTLFLALPW